MILLSGAALLIMLNVATALAFRADKQRAIAGQWRIAESTLLGLAIVGGSPGAIWARHRFRHKTRKQPFSSQLDFIAMMQAGVALGLVIAIA